MKRRPLEEYTLFGQWVEKLIKILGTSKAEICERAGISPSTLTVNTRIGQHGPKEETVLRLWDAFEQMAIERGKYHLLVKKEYFLNAGGVLCERQERNAQIELDLLDQEYPTQ